MATAIIGAGNVGARLARGLVSGGERIVIATRNVAQGESLAKELGSLAESASVPDAIAKADTVIFAVWLDTIQDMVQQYADVLPGKIVVDASNPLAADGKGGFRRTLPESESSGELVAGLVPQGAYFVKAFGTVGAESLSADANRKPERAVLFYATAHAAAESTVERLITAAGFMPLKVGGVEVSGRIEVGGDLHQFGGLGGRVVSLSQAKEALASAS
ncbi:NADPH-dependent F420 reductase [Rhodococcus tibetensis]|uniref:NAD(P)-binding domain-containing protein n=1 Tax=Rhodococcus tibetensis TaxID=2965064 RepID=A0ABT1QJ91_9NOCA|nr:NAD(P)-binding domain-containing protein [Rhodococcus sp. FXJ9.536]MCQ4122334.1 NAD(P)-binding domain-containing protein [Rhodococcus sp. FXJ9.536]